MTFFMFTSHEFQVSYEHCLKRARDKRRLQKRAGLLWASDKNQNAAMLKK